MNLDDRQAPAVGLLTSAELKHKAGTFCSLGGTPPGEPSAAREWRSHFLHEATFAREPLPSSAHQQTAPPAYSNLVLIADDDPMVRGSLAAVLESEGYLVEEAGDGKQAVTRAIEHLPDLVLLDLSMPQGDGWTALSQLERVTPWIPIIVITACPSQYDKAARSGVDAFMEKPLSIPVLVRAIKRLTSQLPRRHGRSVSNSESATELLAGMADQERQHRSTSKDENVPPQTETRVENSPPDV